MNQTTDQPLTDDEFARLSGVLDAIGPSAMNIEMLDGYFAALICGPDMVLPSEYLPQIWGEDFAFESDGQTAEIMGLLMRHWNTIATELLHTLDKPDVYLPVLLEGDDGIAPGNDWAHGFMRGVETRPASRGELIDDEDYGGPMLPIMMLHHEHDPDPQMRPPADSSGKARGTVADDDRGADPYLPLLRAPPASARKPSGSSSHAPGRPEGRAQ